MLKIIAKNLITMIAFLFVLSVVVFLLARVAPSDPLQAYYGDALERMSEAQRAQAMTELSLDKPLPMQYFSWLGGALCGDFGVSHLYKQDTGALISKFSLNSLLLGGISYVLTFVLAILFGTLCAAKQGSILDRIIHRIGTATSVIPNFFVALIAILIFAVNLKLLPTGAAYSIGGGGFVDRATHLVLPVLVMVVTHLWYFAYMIRNKLIEEMGKDYVVLLRVKQLSGARILFKHCLKNALPMILTLMAVSVPHILAGTYIVEVVFAYPGLGSLIFDSAQYRDFNLLAALTMLSGFLVLLANLLAQIFTERFDARMRTGA